MRAWLIACLLAISSVAQAEVFYGIEHGDTLGDVKKMYPSANYRKLSPAWLQPDQSLIAMSGFGLAHELIILFSDMRPFFSEIKGHGGSDLNNWSFANIAAQPDSDALKVEQVRVRYTHSVKIDSFKQKYGKSTCKDDDDFQKICVFPDRAITALLSEDGRFVLAAESNFTDKEKKLAARKREVAEREKAKREAHPMDAPAAAPRFDQKPG